MGYWAWGDKLHAYQVDEQEWQKLLFAFFRG
jgi:hypothetical protein